MSKEQQAYLSRRAFLWRFMPLSTALVLAACDSGLLNELVPNVEADGDATNNINTQALEPTPACGDDDDEPTLAQTEGPYFTPNSPERSSLLEANMPGTRMVVSGLVVTTNCEPVARALLDFWHADDAGVYDNVGYRLRGHLFTDEQGRYRLETIVPGLYPGRTRHFHVKVQAPNQPVLTTQLYFPDEPANQRDGIYRPELLMNVQEDGPGGKAWTFNFVLEINA